MKDLVSIVIPTYNRPKKLKRAVNSVLQQSYNNFEVLVVNDSSAEQQVIDVISELNDTRLKYFRNLRTKGANGARNTGILNSKGNFVAFLDDDDEWLQNKLETQMSCIKSKQKDYAGVYSAYQIEKKNKLKEYRGNKEGNLLNEIILDDVKICTGSNLMVKSEVFEKVGLWDEELLRQQDLEFLIRFLMEYKLAYDDHIVTKIYGHNTPNPKKAFDQREKYLKKISKYLKFLSKNEKDQFYSDHYRRQTMYLMSMRKFKLANENWRESKTYIMFSLRKDLKISLLYLKNYLA